MGLSKEYTEHKVFERLDEIIDFYKSLAFSVFGFMSLGTKSVVNIDSYVYSSVQGTVESIKVVLQNGRMGDSYALLRKYYDSCIINIYSGLYLRDNFSENNLVVEKINNWLNGKEQMPEFRVMSNYLRGHKKLTEINDLLYNSDDRYKRIRNRCNDHTHYNFYHNVLLNDNEVVLGYRNKALDILASDVENVFILHLSYLMFLNEHYMMASDYRDYLEVGLTPDEGMQYEVAPFFQKVFDDFVKAKRPDIAEKTKLQTCMRIK